ncbi:MAG: Rieske (2Fe-2S) protein [Bacteroidota bacterium]
MANTRKEFLIQLAVGGVALGTSSAIASFLASCSLPTEPQGTNLPTTNGTVSDNQITVDISSGSPLAKNGFAIVQYSGGSVLVDHADDGSYHAMTSVCTHAGCIINQYNSTSKEFVCPCHGSRFSNTGAVTNGPATIALKQYVTSVNGTQLIITLS